MQVNVNTAQASMNHAPSGSTPTTDSNAAQTLADLKKQRSMHRVAQQSPRSGDQGRGDRDRDRDRERGNAPSGGHSSSHSSKKQKEDIGQQHSNHRHSSKRNSKNGRNGHRSDRGSASNNVKKFASPTEVVGPSPKKVGCCRVM